MACFAIYHWTAARYLVGNSLNSMEADLQLYTHQMKNLKQDHALHLCKCFQQVFLNLMGYNNEDSPTLMEGEALNEQEYKHAFEHPSLHPGSLGFEGMLLTYFGKHVEICDLILKHGHAYWAKTHLANPNLMWEACLKGVSGYAAAHQTGRQQYKKIGKVYHHKIKSWLKQGNPNVAHYNTFLDAEKLVVEHKNAKAVKCYELAVVLSARGGYQHDAAFVNERLAEFQLNTMNDHEEAKYRLCESVKYWQGWGAMAKVKDLQKKYPSFLLPHPVEAVSVPLSSLCQSRDMAL